MSLTIDELNLKIESDASDAGENIDSLIDSLTRLRSAVDFANQLVNLSAGFTALAASSGSLDKINYDKFTENVKKLSTSLQPLQGFKTQASGLLSSIRGFSETAEAFNNFDGFEQFGNQVETLASKLEPLNKVSSKLGATLNALGQLQQISAQLNGVHFGDFGSDIETLATSLEPLSNIHSRLGATMTQLSRLNQLTETLKNADYVGLQIGIGALSRSLRGLSKIETGKLGTTLTQLRKLPETVEGLKNVDMRSFSTSIKQLADALEPLSKQLDNISGSFAKLPKEVNKCASATEKYTKSVQKSVGSHTSMTSSLAKNIVRYRIIANEVRNITSSVLDWFQVSNDYIESLNLFTVTMGDSSQSAMDFAESMNDLMGIDIAEWMNYQGTFQQLVTGFGVSSDAAKIMSRNLSQLSYDLASFFNTDVETAFDKLSSGMTGQIKGLKEYGLNLSITALGEYALSKGIEKSTAEMTEAEKALLRYSLLMEKTVNIQGDMARTLVTPANSMRILSSYATQFERALGNVASVLIVQVIPYLQAGMKLLTEYTNLLAADMGFEITEIDYSGLSSAFEGASDDADDTEDSVKNLKNSLLGFDEFNILKSGLSTTVDTEGIDGFDKLLENLQSYDFTMGMSEQSNEIYDKLKAIFELIDEYSPILMALGAYLGTSLLTNLLGGTAGSLAALGSSVSGVTGLSTVGAGIARFSGSLSSLLGVLPIAVAALAGLSVVEDKVAEGSMSVSEGQWAAVPSSLAMGGAIATLVGGPIGGLLACLATVATWLISVRNQEAALSAEIAKSKFFDGNGVKVSDIAEEYRELAASYTEFADTVIANQSAIEANDDTIKDCNITIERLLEQMQESTDGIADECVPDIINAFEALADAVEDNIKKMHESLSTGFGEDLPDDLQGILDEAQQQQMSRLEALKEQYTELLAKDTTGMTSEEKKAHSKEITSVKKEMSALGGVDTGDANTEFKSLMDAKLRGIDWEDADEASAALASLESEYKKLEGTLSTVLQGNLDDIGKLLSAGVITQSDHDQLESYYNSEYERKMAEANELYYDYIETMKNDFLLAMDEALDDVVLSFGNKILSLGGQYAGYDKEDVEDFLKIKQMGLESVYLAFAEIIKDSNGALSGEITIPQYANGGLPASGELFIANEAGPELVGTIGGSTAVANNDMIISGIAEGVYNAVVAAISDSKSDSDDGGEATINVNVMVEDDVVGQAAARYNRRIVNSGGRSPFTTK